MIPASIRLAAASTVALVLTASPPLARAQCECPVENALVIGHRGNGTGADENTLASAEAAFTAGADMVEIDVQLSSDGVVVLMHDDTVDRTTDGTGCVSALNAAELAGLGVPTLAEFLAGVDGGVNVEVKLHETDACPAQDLDALAAAVVADLAADPVDARPTFVTSFDLAVLQRIAATAPELRLGLISGSPDAVATAEAEGFAAAMLLDAVVNARTVRSARAAGIELHVWTVNGQASVAASFEKEIDGVITDTPAEALLARAAVCDAWTCDPDAGPGEADAGPGGGEDGGGCGVAPGAPRGLPGLALALAALALGRRRR